MMMTLNWQKSSRCWSCFWYLSRLKKKRRRRMKNREAE